MATVNGTLGTTALNRMADAIKDSSTLTLQAWSTADPTATLLDSKTPTFSSASGGESDLTSNVVFTLTAGEVVGTVRLYSVATQLASVTLSTENNFPAGGDLIVENYTITVT